MMAREFSKVSPSIWHSSAFRKLSDRVKILHLYLISNGHVTSAGCYVLPAGYACTDLRWSSTAYGKALRELVAAGLVDHDPDHDAILIEGWFASNPPMNDKHATGTAKLIETIESQRFREKSKQAFEAADASRVARQFAEQERKANGRAHDAERAAKAKREIEAIAGSSPELRRSLQRQYGRT